MALRRQLNSYTEHDMAGVCVSSKIGQKCNNCLFRGHVHGYFRLRVDSLRGKIHSGSKVGDSRGFLLLSIKVKKELIIFKRLVRKTCEVPGLLFTNQTSP